MVKNNDKEKFYAWAFPSGEKGITRTWDECYSLVKNVAGVKYKRFLTQEQAQAWLSAGADYSKKYFNEEEGVFFDSGTGGTGKVRVRITDREGNDLIENLPVKHLDVTNNYGELLALKYALEYALQKGIKNIFGDSQLVITYWSKGRIRLQEQNTLDLVNEVVKLRTEFEDKGGQIKLISGDNNPADLGFHRK
jgi:ribonuclease HI